MKIFTYHSDARRKKKINRGFHSLIGASIFSINQPKAIIMNETKKAGNNEHYLTYEINILRLEII